MPLVEAGHSETPQAEAAAREYLEAALSPHDAHVVILGCTHYPFLLPVLRKVAGPGIVFIDPAGETVRELDCTLATLAGDSGYGLVEHGAIGWHDGVIAFAGAMRDLPGDPDAISNTHESVHGALVTPGLVDCHTHLVFGGERANEFEMRLHGESYEAIARAGGGIVSSVHATRAASEDDLAASALGRLDALIAEGVGTVEVKSGYGLNLEDLIPGIAALGVPIRSAGQPVASLSLGTTPAALEGARREMLLDRLRREAARIEALLQQFRL